MKRHELKDKIKQAAINEMPDVLERIHLENIHIEPETKTNISWHRPFRWAVSAFVFILVGFFSFQLFFSQPSTEPFQTDVELLAFQTVSAQSLIEYGNATIEDLNLEPLSVVQLNDTDANEVEAYLDEMGPMIELAELLINQRDEIQYTERNSDREAYAKQIRFNAVNLLGEDIQFDIYYNELDDEAEGIVVHSDNTYQFNQNAQRLRLIINSDDYIDVQYIMSQAMHEFNFRYMSQQNQVFSTKIEMVLENTQYRANFEFNNQRGMIIRMQMQRNNDETMDVDYEIDDLARQINGRFNVSVENEPIGGQPFYRFRFDDESETETTRPGQHQPGPPQGPPM